jgi:hypothetical protein
MGYRIKNFGNFRKSSIPLNFRGHVCLVYGSKIGGEIVKLKMDSDRPNFKIKYEYCILEYINAYIKKKLFDKPLK